MRSKATAPEQALFESDSDLTGHIDETRLVTMKAVSVSELKAHLSKYLREVRRGGEIQVLDRGIPVARLSGMPASMGDADDDNGRERLIKAGILRPGAGTAAFVLEEQPLALEKSLLEALDDERDDRL